jgi:hypothetical protein
MTSSLRRFFGAAYACFGIAATIFARTSSPALRRHHDVPPDRTGLREGSEVAPVGRLHDRFECVDGLEQISGGVDDPGGLERHRDGSDPEPLHFQEQPFQIASALAQEHVSAARATRGTVAQPEVEQPVFHERETVGRRHALLRPQAGVDADANPFAPSRHRLQQRSRPGAVRHDSHVDSRLIGQRVEAIQRSARGHDDRLRSHVLRKSQRSLDRGTGRGAFDAIGEQADLSHAALE